MAILFPVMKMNKKKELLLSILQTTQMGQQGIRSVMDYTAHSELQEALQEQLKEYDEIEREAYCLAEKNRWTLAGIRPMTKYMTDKMAQMKLAFGDTDRKIAAMMIRGNTNGMIKGFQNLHSMSAPDSEIESLSHKLLATEKSNVTQMIPFL